MPNIENRIELASDKDEFGMPLGKITHSFDQDAAALWNANFEEGLRIARATDAKDVWQGRGAQPTIHLMGGTIMGRDPNDSVVDADCRAHDHDNLYIAGGATMPTASCINSTLTMVAVSLLMADRLNAQMKA